MKNQYIFLNLKIILWWYIAQNIFSRFFWLPLARKNSCFQLIFHEVEALPVEVEIGRGRYVMSLKVEK